MTPPKQPAVRPCAGDCGKLTHPRSVGAPAGVESVPRIDAKYCLPCYNEHSPARQKRREIEAIQREERKEAGVAAAFQAQEAYLAGRRRRQAIAASRARAGVNA